MDDGAVRPRAGDGREGNVLERAGVATEAFERRNDVDFGQLAARGFLVEPGQKARDGGAIAPVRTAAADDLGVVLGRL
jgi:hypothetical protein